MAEPATPIFHSLDEFLAWEERQELRYEFLPGGIITMTAGGTEDHHQMTTNILVALEPRVRERPCYVYANVAKVLPRRANAIVYPDVMVRCGPRTGKSTAFEDPIVVFEVLSESTAKHDLTRKRQVYKGIPSVAVIVYVSQDEHRLDIVRRGEGGSFDDEVLEGPDAVLTLPEIGAELSLAEIFRATNVATATGDTA